MAFQQGGGMGGGGPGTQDHSSQATEYTLQGVMRFLQLEWHSHERARNAWDIERAEMKAKIVKQEGELQHSRKLNEQLDRQIKMLEVALKNERARGRVQAKAEQEGAAISSQSAQRAEAGKVSMVKLKSDDPIVADSTAALENLVQPELSPEERDQYRDKSRAYLSKCMSEIQYLLAAPPHPPPQPLPNGQIAGLREPPPPIHDDYVRQYQQRQAPRRPMGQHDFSPSQPPVPNPRAAERMGDSASQNDSSYAGSEPSQVPQLHRMNNSQPEALPRLPNTQPLPLDHGIDKSQQSYEDAASRNNDPDAPHAPPRPTDDGDGWNFGEQQLLSGQPGSDAALLRRPDTDAFPSAGALAAKSPPRAGPGSHRRRSSGASGSGRRRSTGSQETHDSAVDMSNKQDGNVFKVKFALRGHLDVVRSVIFTGGGSPSEPEICTAGDDGMIKRWIIPASYGNLPNTHMLHDLDISSYFTHRGHEGIITSLAACPSSSFSTGGRVSGDGWIFSGGQDATIRVWERGRVDPKATLDGHSDAIWSVCVLPGTCGNVFGQQSSQFGGADRILLVSGAADGTVKVWSVSAPPHLAAPQAASRRGVGGSRRHSVTSGSNHPSSPQPNTATSTPFHYTLVHSIARKTERRASPTCICPLSANGDKFVVSWTDSCILLYDTRTGEEVIGMASNETYDGTLATSINTVVATSRGTSVSEGGGGTWSEEQEEAVGAAAGPTGSAQGVEGVIVSGHEDRYIRFFDANSGQCTYTMLAHPSAISSLSLSPDGHEAVSAGHDASIRFWSLDKRMCTQDITSHRPMRGEGVCSVRWSNGYVVSGGGDGVVKVFAR